MKSRTPALDRELLAWTEARWLKVARILGSVMDNPPAGRFRPSVIVSRIQALATAGLIEGRGMLFKRGRVPPWSIRYSEMRLAPRRRRLAKRSA